MRAASFPARGRPRRGDCHARGFSAALWHDDLLVAELAAGASVVAASVFGMPSLKYEGKAFAGFTQGAMVFKLSDPAHAAALALAGAHRFDLSGRDRPMKEWVVVSSDHADRWPDLARAALRYAGGLAIPD